MRQTRQPARPAPRRAAAPNISPQLRTVLTRMARSARPLIRPVGRSSPSEAPPGSSAGPSASYGGPTYNAPDYGAPYADDEEYVDDSPDVDDYDEAEGWEGAEDPGQPEDGGGGMHKYDEDNWDAVGADVSRSPELTWTVDRTPTGWRGTVRIPLDMGRMLQVARTVPKTAGANKATSSALDAASKVLDNPAVAALVPPQARLALQLAKSKTARNIAKKISSIF